MEVINERLKTRDEYASSDSKEAKRLFKSLIGIFNRCNDPHAAKMVEKLTALSNAANKIDYSTFKRRYNYVPVQRRKEDDAVFNNGFVAALDQLEEDGFFNENKKMKTVRLTEADLHEMVVETVKILKENYFYGMDEGGNQEGENKNEEKPATPDDGRPGDSSSEDAQNKREQVLGILRNDDKFSDVRRRNIIYRLWNISDEGDYDTYRSLFSKCLNPEDSSHQFSDSQVNIIYDMITDIV